MRARILITACILVALGATRPAAVRLPEPASAPTRLAALTHTTANFMKALEGIRFELGQPGYQVDVIDVDRVADAAAALQRIQALSPQGLILMDAKAIGLARALQEKSPAVRAMPKFVLMTLQVERAAQGLEKVAGVRFEVPAYTIFTHLRILSEEDFSKVGVIYRKAFTGEMAASQRRLAREKLDLVGYCLDCEEAKPLSRKAMYRKMRQAFKRMVRNDRVEVIWMLADNVLVNSQSLNDFWLPVVQASRRPVVVPLENLAGAEMNLGLFVALPDFMQLGIQVADQIIEVYENGEAVEDVGLEPLISVESVLNLEVARKIGWKIKPDRLERVDRIYGQRQ